MNLLKKVLWLLIISLVTLNATEQNQLCQAFEDGIQTRTNSSEIKFINNSYLFSNPNNSLNGFKVINQNSNLSCRDVNGTTDEPCQSSNALGMSLSLISLQTPEVFIFTQDVNSTTQIKMKKLKVKKNKNLNLTASSAIYLESLKVAKNSTVTIKAPKVVINNLNSFKKSNIKIIADTIDIKTVKLENRADLIIKSFTEDAKIEMRIEKLKLKKASILLNNGLYHIKRVELKNRSSLKVGDSVQIVNKRTVVLNHSRVNASKNRAICNDEHNPNALFIYSNDLVRVENHSNIVAMVYNERRVEFTKYSGLKGAVSAKNRAIVKNHSKVCYTKCSLTSNSTDDVTPPVITLNGDSNLTLTVGETYTELGATALDDVDGNVSVTISGTVDTATVGVYILTYSATDVAGNDANVTRTINVVNEAIVDTTPPVITLNGDANVTIEKDGIYTELNATAVDNVDGNVSVTISGTVDTSTVGVYILTYSATDVAGNEANVTRTINVVNEAIVDITPPVITLNGNQNISITKGDTYNELGATAIDDVEGNVNVTVSGEVDTSRVGTYTITYTAVDSAENRATLSRTVNVIEPVVKYGVNIGEVQGNTATYYNVARFSVSLRSKPEANVTIPISSSDENEGKIQPINGDNTKLRFSPDNWNTPQMIYVKGQHQNPVDTVQNYKIVLSTIVSDDANYDGINPTDVDMKGLELTLKKPTDVKFIANLPKTVNIETSYNGTRRLTYTLLEHPDGMTISSNSSWISWTAPESAEGNSYPVKIKVENREFSSEISFNVHVADTTTIQTEINGTKIIVTEEGNLKGLEITTLDNNIDPSDIKLSKTSQSNLQEIPDYVTKISDFFVFNELISGKVRIKLPLSQLPAGVNLNYIGLYCLGTAQGINEEFWASLGVDKKIIYKQGEPFLQLELYELEGASFIGFEIPEFPNKNAPLIPFQKKNSTKFSKINISDVNCTPIDNNGSLNYMIQNCRVNNSNIKVENFGISSNSIRWGVVIEELITWIVDSRDGFDKLNLDYDNNFTVNIGKMRKSKVFGFVDKQEDYKILHLTSINYISKAMQTTAIHEYLHHAQSRSKIGNHDLMIHSGFQVDWFIEGSAVWFTDYDTLDSLNGYSFSEGKGYKILEAGLNSRPAIGTDKEYQNNIHREYQRFSFLKLTSSKCRNFDNVFREMLNINRNVDPSGIKNFINELENANCDFGNQLGEDKNSSLESALLYYQYATIQEDNIKLLDSNEDRTKFDFDGTWSAYKRDWSELYLLNFILDKIPAYGANSFKIDFDDFAETNGLISLNIQTDKPLTVVGIRLDENGKSTQIGVENNFHFTTEAGIVKEYNLTDEDRAGGLFITLLNATDKEVEILDLNLTIRRFTRDNTTNIVTDHERGLMWQDETDTWLDSWYGAGRHCTALTLGDYDDWRVPTYDELIHILDLDGEDTYRYKIFEHLGPVGYWSLDRNGGVFPDSESAKVVNFGLATWIWINTSQNMNTRCVRTK